MNAAEQRAQDKERLEDVTHVLHGPHGTGAVQRVLYAVYLLALLAFTYGFTVARALFITKSPSSAQTRFHTVWTRRRHSTAWSERAKTTF